MSIFDAIAIEAAAKALYAKACEQRGFRNDIDEMWEMSEFRESCTDGLKAALDAAEASLRERGNLELVYLEATDKWLSFMFHKKAIEGKTTGPVAIIRIEQKP